MSRHRSRSPLHSRPSALLGRRDGYYGEQYHAPVRSDPWRGSENIDNRNTEGGMRWDNVSSKPAEEQVDHWAKFIEAIDRAGKPKSSSASRYHAQVGTQSFEGDSACSPRRLPRERLSSPETSRYGLEKYQRIQSPGQRRNEHDGAHVDRCCSRSSSPRHSQGKRHDRMERGYNEEPERRYERSERSLKSNYMKHQLHFKGYQDLDPKEKYTVSHRSFSPHCSPVIVEHGHGIRKHDSRIHNSGRDQEHQRSRDSAGDRGHSRNRDSSRDREQPRSGGPYRDRENPRNRNPLSQREHPRSLDPGRDREHPRASGPVRQQEHPRSLDTLRTSDLPRDRDFPKGSELQRGRDATRGSGSSRSKEVYKDGRDYNHHPGTSQDVSSNYHIRQDTGFHTSLSERGNPLRSMQHHKEQPRMESHSRERHGRRPVDNRDFKMDESNRARGSISAWEEETQPRGNHGGVLGQGNVLKRNPQHRNTNHPGGRTDFAGHETLKIKVDMSRPVHQSSSLGYSSERQLSLDLVNVGRQRLDFLPMLEHSGTFRETALHSGTFAQEIITLVHQVKENYFYGQGVTLNQRFSNEQEYSLVDERAEEDQEMEGVRPVLNRPFGLASSDTQIFCKIGSVESQRRPHIPAPGDLRHDLERKRQERLEGVKITIENFSQILPQSQENVAAYVDDEDPCETGWSEEVLQQTENWDDPLQERPVQNLNTRRNFGRIRRRPRPCVKRNSNDGAQW